MVRGGGTVPGGATGGDGFETGDMLTTMMTDTHDQGNGAP